ncbi:MAG TPA: hypothetical protein K8V44_06605 [Staphylococcus saprophyticus]|nr:hypothetical protein [Staphylococcus saprophyticus]
MNTKKDIYNAMIEDLLLLMNSAKEMGYILNIEEVSKSIGVDMNNIDRMNHVDMVLQLSINKTYQKNNALFKTLIVNG